MTRRQSPEFVSHVNTKQTRTKKAAKYNWQMKLTTGVKVTEKVLLDWIGSKTERI